MKVTGPQEIRHPCLSSRWHEHRVRASLLAGSAYKKNCNPQAIMPEGCMDSGRLPGTRDEKRGKYGSK